MPPRPLPYCYHTRAWNLALSLLDSTHGPPAGALSLDSNLSLGRQDTPMTMTKEEVEAVLTEIVSEKPEGFTYAQHPAEGEPDTVCLYRNPVTGEPDCIVGHFIARLGLPIKPEYEGESASALFTNGGRYLAEGPLSRFVTSEAVDYLQRVQSRQDSGETWADAIQAEPVEVFA